MEISTWFIVAQVLGVITICFEFASYQIKNKQTYLLVNGIGSAFWAFMFLAVGMATTMSTQITLFIVGIYSSARALVFFWIFQKDTIKRRRIGKGFLIFMIFVALSAGITMITRLPTTGTIILQAVSLVFALGFVIGQYMPGKHPVRISVFFYAIMLLLNSTPLAILDGNGIERWNIMGIAIEASKIISVLLFYIIFVHKKVLANKLVQIKSIVACEMSKITACSSVEEIANIMPPEKLEKLAVKMVQYELSLVERDKMIDINCTRDHTRAVLEDIQTVQDVKNMLEKLMRLKMQKLDKPKMTGVAKEAILGQ